MRMGEKKSHSNLFFTVTVMLSRTDMNREVDNLQVEIFAEWMNSCFVWRQLNGIKKILLKNLQNYDLQYFMPAFKWAC